MGRDLFGIPDLCFCSISPKMSISPLFLKVGEEYRTRKRPQSSFHGVEDVLFVSVMTDGYVMLYSGELLSLMYPEPAVFCSKDL